MTVLTRTAVSTFAPTNVNGQIRGPLLDDTRTWAIEIETLVCSLNEASTATGSFFSLTLAGAENPPLQEDGTPFAANDARLEVVNDGANNGVYIWDGTDWVLAQGEEFSFVQVTVTNADPDAIVATSSAARTDGGYLIRPIAANTGATTLDLNGVIRPLRAISGLDLPANALVPGKGFIFIDTGTEFLLADGNTEDTAQAQAAAAQALNSQNLAEGFRDEAEAFAAQTNLGLNDILEDVVRTDDIADVVRTDDLAASVQTEVITVGQTTGQNIATTGAGVQARSNGSPSDLVLNPDGGDILINGEVAWHSGNLTLNNTNIVQNHVTAETLFLSSSNTHITPLNTTINKTSPDSAIRITARISMDRQHNGILYVRRGTVEIGSHIQVGVRTSGMVPIPFDDNIQSAMFSVNVAYIDETSDTGDIQYEFWVRGGTVGELALNRTRDDNNISTFERGTSQVILEEIFLGG